MKFKTNAIIGLIFLGLLGFVYFYEIKGGEQRRQEAEKSKQLLDFKDTEVQRIELVRGDTTVVLDKGTDGWRLSAPVSDGASQDAVERYLRNLGESEREKTVVDSASATASQAAKYGLDTPRLKVALGLEGGAEQAVAFGTDSPTDRFTYVQKQGGNPEIFVVRAWRFDNLDKGVFDLRDRRVLAFAKDDVVEVRRAGLGGDVVLAREGEAWQLREPLTALADAEVVKSLLNKIDTAEIESFVAEAPDEEALKTYGLGGQTGVEIALLIGPDRAEKRLAIGVDNGQGRFYARDASRPQVFLVDSTVVQQLTKGLDELRDKKPLRFDRGSVEHIALIKNESQIFAVEKDTAGVWSLTNPADREVKSWKLNGLLTDLGQLEVAGFAAKLPQAAAEILGIELAGGGQPLLSVRISQAEGTLYLQAEGDASVYVVSADDFSALDLGLDDVAQAPKAPIPVNGAGDG